MARRDPLLPNAAIVARREYRDRVRSPLFMASTVLLMGLAMLVAMSPIAIRYLDRQTVTHLAIVSSDGELGNRSRAVVDSVLNQPPADADPATWKHPFEVRLADDLPSAQMALANDEVGGVLIVERQPNGRIEVTFRAFGMPDAARIQLLQIAAFSVGILDWTSGLPTGSQLGQFQTPSFRVDSLNVASDGGRTLGPVETASRSFLGIVFVVLLFITVVIYGMWVATGVASEKSSRVMELMISAASPRQMLTGKVVGIGAAGLTQYVAIAIPALVLVALQDRIADAALGPGRDGAPLVGLTPALLAGYGVFFLLGFTLFALIYASMGSFVSRPDDLQTLSLPLSLVAMLGYLSAIVALGGQGGPWVTIASFLPPFSPFVMLARIMVSAVAPWEVVLSVVLLVVAIAVVAVVATRMYAAGVLLYGTRPGLRAFVTAARRAA